MGVEMVKKRDESRITRFLAWALGGRLNTEQLLHVGKCHTGLPDSVRQPHFLNRAMCLPTTVPLHSVLYAWVLVSIYPTQPPSTLLTDSSFSSQLKYYFSWEAWPDYPIPGWVRSPAECSHRYMYFTFKALIMIRNYLPCVIIYSVSVSPLYYRFQEGRDVSEFYHQ